MWHESPVVRYNTPMDTDVIISLNHVSFSYRLNPVLEDIELEIRRGDYLGIIGPNGSGKTTLLKLMLGLLRPTAGEVRLFGEPASAFRAWQNIGYVPQKAGSADLRFPVTVEETIWMATRSSGDIAVALRAVGMENFRSRLLSELSGGQQQRVFIARALVSDPEILILDEPTVGVDVDSQSQFYELLQDLNQKRHKTLVLVSHDVDVVAHEVKTVACINRTLVFHGPPKEVIQGDFLEKLYGKKVRFVVHGH
jgi:zinc transport system ATP-binding protein